MLTDWDKVQVSKEEWLDSLKTGDKVAVRKGRGWRSHWAIDTVVKEQRNGHLKLSDGTSIGFNGAVAGVGGYIAPLTEEVETSVWRQDALREISNNLMIGELSDNNLNRLLQILKEHQAEQMQEPTPIIPEKEESN